MNSARIDVLLLAVACAGIAASGCDLVSGVAEAASFRRGGKAPPALGKVQRSSKTMEAAQPSMRSRTEPVHSAEARALSFTRAFEAPPPSKEAACPDATFSGLEDAELALIRRVEDTRDQGKNLLPLEVRELLESREFDALRREVLQLSNPKAASAPLEAALGRLAERQFFGIHHVVEYREPRLIYNLKKNKREWRKGVLETTFAIYRVDQAGAPLEVETPLCQTRVRVETDVHDKPTTRRRQSETHAALLLELGELTRRATPAALRRLTPRLRYVD